MIVRASSAGPDDVGEPRLAQFGPSTPEVVLWRRTMSFGNEAQDRELRSARCFLLQMAARSQCNRSVYVAFVREKIKLIIASFMQEMVQVG